MKKWYIILWLIVPVAALGYHFAAGEHYQKMDAIGGHLRTARSLAQQTQWSAAVAEFETALESLPDDADSARRELRLELAQAKMNASRLPEAHEDLKKLLDEMLAKTERQPDDAEFENRVRESLASSQYYMTWLMRLEGLPRDEWEPEIESARQNYRLLAERADETGRADQKKTQLENLEASIKLARLDLSDLQGLPIPSQ
ncbi:MAG TPA: hypothetical protein PLR25_10980 [Planctomycetaceae bacterium]|nr:hypothetical protein [Planctomycetaceae bacterium]